MVVSGEFATGSKAGDLFTETVNQRIQNTSEEDRNIFRKILQNLLEEMIFRKEKSEDYDKH